ncbi:MAG: hypothetical protein JWP08_3322 [Bryobacterales bacterium]|nr:hypothetical protein [Bryobacterales bacterium]
MIDLEEAARSFDSYTLQLDLLCLEYSFTSAVPPQWVEPQITSKDEVMDQLRQCRRDATVLGILVTRRLSGITQLGAELPFSPELTNASKRMAVASEKARALIEEHDHKQKAKNLPPEQNELAIAIRRFKEEHGMI